MTTNTLLHRLYEWSTQNPIAPAQAYLNNNKWQLISVKALVQKVEKLAQYLNSIGVRENDIGVIYSYNRPEWVQLDLALMLVGASSAGVYVNASLGQIDHILKHSEAKILIVDNLESLNKISNFIGAHTSLIKIIVIDPQNKKLPELAISLNEIFQVSEKTFNPTYQEFLVQIKLSQRAMLIYTSGTTGQSKAVSLSHQNLNFAAECYATSWEAPKSGRLFSFLPLAHVAERITNLGIGIANRYTVYFCSDPMSIAAEMREVEPTIALAVPRLWDKFKEGVEKQLARAPKRRQKLVRWAMANAKKYQNLKVGNKFISPLLQLKYFSADKLILSKIRKQLGLGRALRVVSGAAALSFATLEWYRGIGVVIIEAYALSESTGVLTCGMPNIETATTVGVPYRGIEIRLANDGEIQTRGPHVFQGYFKDDTATQALYKEGWLCTGDIGALDSFGNLKILGRRREIIKTGEGKMVSPLYLEALLESHQLIDQAIVIGNERPYLVALVTLVEGIGISDHKKEIQNHIDILNRDLANYERIKQFCILSKPFSIARDEVTATLKIKRIPIEKNYQDEISVMYKK